MAAVVEDVADDADVIEVETPIDDLEREIMLGAAINASSMCRWLLLVAEFDRRHGYERWERRSTAEWLEWKCGIRSGTAHDHVRVARALPDLPKVRGAFATGALSYSKVRALVRVATPATEADLVEMARLLTGNQLERTISAYARAVRELTDEDLERMEAKRSVQRRRDRDGDGWVWTLHLSDEEDALLERAIDFVRDDSYAAARAEAGGAGGPRVERMSRVDAVVEVVARGLRNAADVDGTPKENYLVTVHVEAGAIASDGGLVHLGGGAVLHPRTAQRLGCDAMVQLALDDAGGTPMKLGRSARLFTRDQRRAKLASHDTCEFPGGCSVSSRYCTMHHAVWWSRGGPTDLDNAVLLCRRHHRSVHEGGWELVREPGGGLAAVSPDGRRIPPDAGAELTVDGDLDVEGALAAAGQRVEPDYDPYFEPRGPLRNVVDSWLCRHYPITPTAEEIERTKRAVHDSYERYAGGHPDPWRPDLN